MSRRADRNIDVAAGEVADNRERLNEQGDGLAFKVRLNRKSKVAGRATKRRGFNHLRPNIPVVDKRSSAAVVAIHVVRRFAGLVNLNSSLQSGCYGAFA